MNTTIKRWVFCEKELKNPKNCSGNDEFIATIKVPLTDCAKSDAFQELDIMVTREGTVRNYYEDGKTGLTPEHRILAENEVEYTKIEGNEVIHYDTWVPVEVDEHDRFIRIAKIEPWLFLDSEVKHMAKRSDTFIATISGFEFKNPPPNDHEIEGILYNRAGECLFKYITKDEKEYDCQFTSTPNTPEFLQSEGVVSKHDVYSNIDGNFLSLVH
jgi:hypothetical protein